MNLFVLVDAIDASDVPNNFLFPNKNKFLLDNDVEGIKLKRLMVGSPSRQLHKMSNLSKRGHGTNVGRSPRSRRERGNDECIDLNLSMTTDVSKDAKVEEKSSEAEERLSFLEQQHSLCLHSTIQKRAQDAIKRAEKVLLTRQLKARYHHRTMPVLERRYQSDTLRATKVQNALILRSRDATLRLEHNIQIKKDRAKYEELRVEKVKQRRSILEFERRSALLFSLDSRTERAARNKEQNINMKVRRAREEIQHALLVSRRVRAAKIVQRVIRNKLGLSNGKSCNKGQAYQMNTTGYSCRVSQNAAAVRLQGWKEWRTLVVRARFFSDSSNTHNSSNGYNQGPASPGSARESLQTLVTNMVQKSDDSLAPLSFENMRSKMTQVTLIKAAKCVLDNLSPLLPKSLTRNNVVGINCISDRALLSAFLIAFHPDEVLGGENGDTDKRSFLLLSASRKLVNGMKTLNDWAVCFTQNANPHLLQTQTRDAKLYINEVVLCLISYWTLFQLWKDADLIRLISDMTSSAEQSWVAYLTSSEGLTYMNEKIDGAAFLLTNPIIAVPDNVQEKASLISLRMRLEASKSGSRRHIKRIRVSLNKLVGESEGRRIIGESRDVALRLIETGDCANEMKKEVDGLCIVLNPSTSDAERTVPLENKRNVINSVASNTNDHQSDDLCSELLLSNIDLVHLILLTDPSDIDNITGGNCLKAHPTDCVKEFMQEWKDRLSELAGNASYSGENLNDLIANTMKKAWYDAILHDIQGRDNMDSVKHLFLELHKKMRKLVPNRVDLHCYVDDTKVAGIRSTSDMMLLLLNAGEALSKRLEAPNRAESTLHWLQEASACQSERQKGKDFSLLPFSFMSIESFIVASLAFLIEKTDLCQADIFQSKLTYFAPLIRENGIVYVQRYFQEKHGNDLHAVPATIEWLRTITVPVHSSPEQRICMIKSQGFVDGVLFAQPSFSMPEVLALDAERILGIRATSKISVIASALTIHACNASKVSATLQSKSFSQPNLESHKEIFMTLLKAEHLHPETRSREVADSVVAFAYATGGQGLSPDEEVFLRNCVRAVLRGDDPVLRLLDNRIRQFFRFVCKGQFVGAQFVDAASNSGNGDNGGHGFAGRSANPVLMQAGRRSSVEKMDTSASGSVYSRLQEQSRIEFEAAAKREAGRLGFFFFANELVDAGYTAHKIIGLCCKLYYHNVLGPLITNLCAPP